MDKRGIISTLLTELLFFCVIASHAEAQPFLLSKVADLNTQIPDGSGNFTYFFGNPVISGSNVAFHSRGEGGQEGIYLYSGANLSKVADLNTQIPGGSEDFLFFYSTVPATSGKKVVFQAGASQQGIYLHNGMTLSKVADLNTSIPEGLGTFSGFTGPVINGNNIAFLGHGIGQEGIYLYNGTTLSKVADFNTPIPSGSGNFTSLGIPMISGGNVVFVGGGIQAGIYLFQWSDLEQSS